MYFTLQRATHSRVALARGFKWFKRRTDQQKRINTASGEADAIYKKAEATARSVRILADSIKRDRGSEAASLRIAEQYVDAFGKLAKEGTTVLLPPNGGFADAASMVAQAMGIYQKLGGDRREAVRESLGATGATGVAEAIEETEAPSAAADKVTRSGFTLDISKKNEDR